MSNYRITKAEWQRLNSFFVTIQPPAQNELFASGDHYTLYLMLMEMGFRPPYDAMELYRMAEEILVNGYDE